MPNISTSPMPSAGEYERLGRTLRVIRRKAGITQRQLGEQLGLRSEFVSAVERGTRGIRWHRLVDWLSVCNSSYAELAQLLEADDS
jgi:transcriptional regulator with XRE-family HTH domain